MNDKQMQRVMLSDQKYFIGRRGIDFRTKEQLIDYAGKLKSLDEGGIRFYDDNRKLIELVRRYRKDEDGYHFFWETSSPFSQWHPANFSSSGSFHFGMSSVQREWLKEKFSDVLQFSSAEQYMMYHKAIVFFDFKSADKILECDDCRKIKKIGREVEGFDELVWRFYRSEVVYQGNYLKFHQNPALMDKLADTMGTTLVEASPNDSIWGIGLPESSAYAKQRSSWKGLNLLGELLTLIRYQYMGL
jgi:ribA/ribD-fused uncharacterized protein